MLIKIKETFELSIVLTAFNMTYFVLVAVLLGYI